MQSLFAPSLPDKLLPFALYFSMLDELDRAGSTRLADFLNATAARVDGGVVDQSLVSVIWFNDLADYIITTQECVARAIYQSLERVSKDLGFALPVKIIFGVRAASEYE